MEFVICLCRSIAFLFSAYFLMSDLTPLKHVFLSSIGVRVPGRFCCTRIPELRLTKLSFHVYEKYESEARKDDDREAE